MTTAVLAIGHLPCYISKTAPPRPPTAAVPAVPTAAAAVAPTAATTTASATATMCEPVDSVQPAHNYFSRDGFLPSSLWLQSNL